MMVNPNYQQSLRHNHRINRVLWISVLAGMVVIFFVALAFRINGLIDSQIIQVNPKSDNLFLLITIGLLFLILYLKRHYLLPDKIVLRAKKKQNVEATGDLAEFSREFGNAVEPIVKALILLRRYYMLVWSVANLILLLGFIAFILAGQFQTFLVYTVVSFYSIVINFPSFKKIEAIVDILEL